MKIPPMGAELLHVDGQTDRQTDRQARQTDRQARQDRQTDRQDEANSRLFFVVVVSILQMRPNIITVNRNALISWNYLT
jgi:hypothetical protein